jgi:hypothetical protein
MPAASDFRALERQNRRETVVLVSGFIVIFLLIGGAFDFFGGTFTARRFLWALP